MPTPATPDPAPVVPETYRVERELTGGGMSRVFVARDEKLRRRVVIKMLTAELSATLSASRFEREISLVAGLRHPHIVPLLDAGACDGALYYTMPYIAGESVRDRLRRDGAFPVDEAVRLTLQVADALGYAHAEGIVHRDIKPENILLDSGHAVVTDFGIARVLSQSETHALTRTGVAIGTPAYMSPEQFTPGVEVDGRADVYALGCVLFEMITGRTLVSAAGAGLSAAEPFAPAAVKDVLRKATAANRDERFATAAELSAALRAAPLESGGLSVSRNRRLAVYAAALLVVVLAGLWVLRPPGARLQPHPPGQPLLYVNYAAVPLREVIRDLGPKVQYTMIASKAAEEVRITAKVDGQPWDAAFRAMMNARGLDAEEDSTGILHIWTLAEFDSIRKSKPDVSADYVLCWRSARIIAEMIRPRLAGGSVTVDTLVNQITITAKPDVMRYVLDFIKRQDVGTSSFGRPNRFCPERRTGGKGR